MRCPDIFGKLKSPCLRIARSVPGRLPIRAVQKCFLMEGPRSGYAQKSGLDLGFEKDMGPFCLLFLSLQELDARAGLGKNSCYLRRSRQIRERKAFFFFFFFFLLLLGGTIFQSPMYSFLGCEKAKTLSKKGCEKAKTLSKNTIFHAADQGKYPFLVCL